MAEKLKRVSVTIKSLELREADDIALAEELEAAQKECVRLRAIVDAIEELMVERGACPLCECPVLENETPAHDEYCALFEQSEQP